MALRTRGVPHAWFRRQIAGVFPDSRRGRATLALIAAINILLAVAYLWSYGGQTTIVRFEVRGNDVSIFVDGKLRNHAAMPLGSESGVRIFEPNAHFDIPSLSPEGGVKHVRASSLDSGETLFETNEDDHAPVLFGGDVVLYDLTAQQWRNYALEVAYENVLETRVDFVDGSEAPLTHVLARFGFNASGLATLRSPAAGEAQSTRVSADIDGLESVRGSVAILLRGYPLAIASVLAIVALALVLRRAGAAADIQRTYDIPRRLPLVLALLIALLFAGTTAFLLRHFSDALPHVADEAANIFQARILASGRTHLETPPIPEAFQFTFAPFIVDYDGRWAAFYTAGHPLTLAPGAFIGLPWLVPPLVGAANVLLLFAIGKRGFNEITGLLAAALFAASPFALMQASSFMAHNTATAYMLAAVLSIISFRERPILGGVLGGLFYGMFFHTRPLSAVAIAVPVAALLLAGLIEKENRLREIRRIGGFAAGGLVMLGLYVFYNWRTTGEALQNGYQASGDLSQSLGFSGAHSVAAGLDNTFYNLATLTTTLNGWPGYVGLAFVLVPFVLATRNKLDWFFLACALAIISSAAFYYTTGPVKGPRYVYEALPFLLLLAARGFDALATIGQRALHPKDQDLTERRLGIPSVIVYATACALIVVSLIGWLPGWSHTWRAAGVPATAAELEDPRSDDRLIRTADHMVLDNALVVMRPCGDIRQCYMGPFLENNLSLDGNVVWVYDVGERNAEVFALYPCRNLFYATYQSATIEAAGTTPPPSGSRCP